jgi:hypothetical protein
MFKICTRKCIVFVYLKTDYNFLTVCAFPSDVNGLRSILFRILFLKFHTYLASAACEYGIFLLKKLRFVVRQFKAYLYIMDTSYVL